MPSCTLEIGGLVVASAEGGAFDAEYALFEAHEIELRSNNEPGTVREHGYQTTVELARERLEASGVTNALADAVAEEMGALVTGYARGPEVRRVASLLRACELFEGRTWNAEAKIYEGGWLEIAALAADTGVEGAARALQALYLAALLHDAKSDAVVLLTTADYTAGRKAGARSHRRVSLAATEKMTEAIRALSEKRGPRTTREGGATRADLLESVRNRIAMCANEAALAKLEALEHALSVREVPTRGPLADAELWALELQLAEGNMAGVQEKLDVLERSRGKAPGTTYLRGRLAFLIGDEAARAIAEKASSLALSMSAFPELELLAAEAWARTGDKKRAFAYARDLAENPQVDAAIRKRARALVEATGEAIKERPASASPAAPAAPEPEAPPPSSSASDDSEPEPPIVAITAGNRASYVPQRAPSVAAPPPPSERTRARASVEPAAPAAAIAPLPIVQVRGSQIPMPMHAPATLPEMPASAMGASRAPGPEPETEPQPAAQVTSDPKLEAQKAPTRPSMRAPAVPSVPPPPHPPSSSPDMDEERDSPLTAYVKGGSQPPFRTEPPPADFPTEPIVPRLGPDRVERAETLSLPADLPEDHVDARPTNAKEARVYFTHLTRELGRLYRTRYNVELRTDLRSIEILQRHLAETFESAELHTNEQVREVHMHGAFLSEVLARRLGAEWIDLAVSEMGYWAMNVPPGTRVWPIGRVIRYVTMQHRERDLVSYVLELQARQHGLR